MRIPSEKKGEEIIPVQNCGGVSIDVGGTQLILWISIEGLNLSAQSNSNEIKVVLECADLPDELDVSTEIHGVLVFDPGQTLAEFGNRNVAGLGSRSEEGVRNIRGEEERVGKRGRLARRKIQDGPDKAGRNLVNQVRSGSPRPSQRKCVACEPIARVRRRIPGKFHDGGVEIIVNPTAFHVPAHKELVRGGEIVIDAPGVHVL